MICPDTDLDCDNVGCRRGGCQGRRPQPPLFRALAVGGKGDRIEDLPLFAPRVAGGTAAAPAADRFKTGPSDRALVPA